MAIGSTGTRNPSYTNGEATNGVHHGYRYSQHYLRKSRPLKIIVIGCGVSGIAAVKMFKDRFHDQPVQLVIYEKNCSVGGTWFENRYPG
jgi:ribulose 1,5-bisphosphate synthetase/thiazole synthase